MWDVFLDALVDSLKIFPFLFLIYLLLEIIESGAAAKRLQKLLSGRFAPAVGALAGIVPECGFSAMYAKLYENRLITTGTLLAIFLSASDEGLIVLLSNGAPIGSTLLLVAIKLVYGIGVGYLVNFLLRKKERAVVAEGTGACVECGEQPEGGWQKYFLHPLLHAAKILLFVFLVNFAFGTMIFLIGEDKISSFLNANAALQPLVAALVGLVPNCAASVVLAQSYTLGAIGFAALAAGLSANAGIGLALIFRNRAAWKKNLFVLAALFAFSVILGYFLLIFN
ncbi:MAG: hypothetical protein DBX59_02690 [Bacillota bacterium]|nr:MAG: hypothetical protein DBX59_02690 [Bacillota bacterium]